MRQLLVPSMIVAALLGLATTAHADNKSDGVEAKKVIDTFLKNQSSPTRCGDNAALCVDNAVFVVTHKKDKDAKMDGPYTIKQLNDYVKGALKEDQKVTIDSITVDVKANTDLAIGFASLKVDETSVRSIFTLAKRDGKWKVMSITQENR